MSVELLRDASRETGSWLIVDGSEQSYVDTADPSHLEFEYVQMISHVLHTLLVPGEAVRALHLGGGLCTVPRWIAAQHPGSRQRVVEISVEIAGLAMSLGRPRGVTIRIGDAAGALQRLRPASVDLVVSDVYDGPETVTPVLAGQALRRARRGLRPGGVYVCNLSDAAPFALARAVAASLRPLFASVTLLAEPAVLRARRSGNVVLAATDRAVDVEALTRRAAAGPVRVRVMAGETLERFVGPAALAEHPGDLPASGESGGRRMW